MLAIFRIDLLKKTDLTADRLVQLAERQTAVREAASPNLGRNNTQGL